MKFLCLRCDEGMKLEAASGPREGSLEAMFVCPRCQYKIVMLTNPWETQLVQSLGVKVGGRTTPAGPYEQVLGSLIPPLGDGQALGKGQALNEAGHTGPGCPFAGMLEGGEQGETTAGIQWTDEAKVRIERIPSFIRPMVQRAIERYAVEQGYLLITDAIMDEARSKLGM
jgi:DNA-directed RNA polymerase subunit RPC12/RpoP